MPVQKITRQTGITSQEILILAGEKEDIRDTILHCMSLGTLDGQIKEAESHARAILASAGSAEADQTPVHYAHLILRHIQLTRNAIMERDASAAAYFAVILGRIACEAELKSKWEKYAMAGARALAGARSGGHARKDYMIYEALTIMEEFDRRLGKARREGKRISQTEIQKRMLRERIHAGAPKPLSLSGIIKAIDRGRRYKQRGGKKDLTLPAIV